MTTRVKLQPAFLLHARPFRDSSRLLDVLTAEHGRLGLVGRGMHRRARGGSLATVLQPFRPLLLSFSGSADLGTLTAVEVAGAPITLRGERLFSGLYLNELLLRLLHRHDPHPALFARYGSALQMLASDEPAGQVLRAFELYLLGELGYGFDPGRDALTHQEVREDAWYRYSEGLGLVECAAGGERRGRPFAGIDLMAIARGDFSGAAASTAKRLLRQVIAEHLDGRPLHTRELFRHYRIGSDENSGK